MLIWQAVCKLDSEQERSLLLQTIGDQVATQSIDLEDAIDRAMALVRSEHHAVA
jgi:hypothetical protein